MSLSIINTREEHARYEALDENTREAIDEAFLAAAKALRARGVKTVGDDRAEELVAAITHYVVRAKE